MSAPSETSPDVRPTSAALTAAIDEAADGIGLVESGRLVLANAALWRLLGDPPAAERAGEPRPGSRLRELVAWVERQAAGDRVRARVALAPGESADVSALSLDLPGYEARAVFASAGDEHAPIADGVERFEALARALCPERATSLALLRDLVAFAPDAAESHPVDVTAVLDAVLDAGRGRLGSRALLVSRFGRVPRVAAREARLAHALWNVITNGVEAFEHKPRAEPRVVVATRTEGPQVIVEVSDTGGGIAESDVERAADLFFTTKPGHAGLGLAAARRVVSAFGGELRVQSLLGEGSAVRIALPAAERRVSTVPPPGANARILIIDDEPLLGQTLKFAFSGRHEVVVAASGREALRLLGDDPRYDLVLCDLMMPDVSGQRVFEAVERDHAALLPRFFFMTGGAFTDSAQEFLERHPERRLDKPFTIADIERLLATLG